MAISDDNKGWDDNFTPIWTTYCPPMSTAALSDNSTAKIDWQPNTNDGSTSGKAIWVSTNNSIKVSGSATKAVDDDNMTINYDFKVDGSSAQAGSGSTYSKGSLSNNTTYIITMDAYNTYNGETGTKFTASQTLYYKALNTYSVTHTLTNVTKATGRDGADAAAYYVAYDATYTANTGYYLPSDITVTIGGATMTKGTDYTWTVTDGTSGSLSILANKINGNVVITINAPLRWAIATSYDSWNTDDHIISNISTSAGVTSGYVDITLPANTGYELKVFDKSNHWLGHTTSGVTLTYSNSGTKYAMAEGNYNLGFTTAGAGSYRFTWDITNSKVSVTYPTSYYVTAAGNPAAGGTVTPSSATYMSTSVGGEITATPNYAYYFNGWTSSAGGTFTSASSATTTFKPASAAATVTAAFPERTAFIEGNFQVYNSTRATRTKTGDSWQDASTAIKMTYDSENNRYYLHTYSTPAELAAQLNSADAYFYVKTSTSSSSIANDATYKAYASAYQSLATYGSLNKQPTGSSEHSFKFTGSEDGYVILYFNGTHVWYELECALSYYGGDGASGDDPASRTYYAYGSNQTAASNTYSKTGYSFDHWDTAADDSGTDYAAGATNVAMNAREVCLHAQWEANSYTAYLDDMGADSHGTENVSVTFNATTNLTSAITKPTKAHYDFGGYYTSEDDGETLGTQLIDANGNWKKSVSGYTGASGDNPTWVHAGDLDLYAKWTEHEYTITTAVSPAGAGSVSCGSSTTAKYVTASGDITASANAGWVFKEWQFSKTGEDYDVYVSDDETYSSTSNPIQILAEHDGTLTAVFEPRYYLVGKIWDDSADGGMPGWSNYNKPFKVVTTSPVLDTCKLTLSTNTSFYIMVRDKADGFSYGKSGETLEDNETLTFTDKDNKVFVYSNGGTEYTFKITAIDGNGRPTVSVERPYQVNVGRKRVDIDGADHDDNTGGMVAMSKTVGGAAVANGAWVPYGTSVKYDASAESGYSLAWFTASDYATQFTTDAYWFHTATSTGNGYAKFTEKATTVALAATNGKIQIGGVDKTGTTAGVTTTRSLTAVPNDGYYFTGWTKTSGTDYNISSTSANPTTLSGRGSGASSGQTLTANFALRYSIKGTMNSENWGTDHFISNFETVGGKVIGYVEMTLSANTSYEFAIYDLANSEWLKSGSNQVYYMTNGNSYVWDFATNKSYNCGITTAGAGTYRFLWNITDKTMSVIYPNFIIYRSGDKAEDPRATGDDVESYAGGTISQAIEFRMKVRELDRWYSLCLPFTVSAVKVWETDRYYDLVPFYRPVVGGTFYTGDYIIRTPKQSTDLPIEEFGDWRDPTSPTGYVPSKNTPYIIQWHDSYFAEEGGRYISFFGAADQTILSFSAGSAPSLDNVVNVCVNGSMTTGSMTGAYMLESDYGNGAWLRLDNASEARPIPPFECYLLVNNPTRARYMAIRPGMTAADTPTGWEEIVNSETKTHIVVYSISGICVTQYNDCSINEAGQRLSEAYGEGLYILRADNESVKLMVGGK
ncbi:MAG: hypothetical protein IJS92_04060 [Paludibacteraceae bacterium]|nr:hypothetical protein [Paludibacteraceae bacterium]